MLRVVNSVVELVGDTLLVRLNRVVPEHSSEIYVKLECQNPGASVKDRIGLSMIEVAKREGVLQLGDTIIEPTSGNTGIGFAMVAAAKGYKVMIVMPDTMMSMERPSASSASLWGRACTDLQGRRGMNGAVRRAEELARAGKHFVFYATAIQQPG